MSHRSSLNGDPKWTKINKTVNECISGYKTSLLKFKKNYFPSESDNVKTIIKTGDIVLSQGKEVYLM